MIKKILIGIGILLIVILVGAGWYFSGLIYEGALNPDFTDSQEIGTAEDRVIVSEIDTKTNANIAIIVFFIFLSPV